MIGKDEWGRDASELKGKKLFLLDMDGTIYQENDIFPGTLPFLRAIEARGGRYVFITNNSSKSVEDYVAKVRRMGIEADAESFFTSVQATERYLKERYPEAKVYCQGTRSMVEQLMAAGIRITEQPERDVDVILVGFDTELTGEKLRNTSELLTLTDAVFLAANPDLRCPVAFGTVPGYIPDCGAMCWMLEQATGKKPIYIGKPEPTMIDIVREKFGCSREETVVVGDRLYTDIASGLNAGVCTVCVLSGEASEADIHRSEFQPTLVFRSVLEMAELLENG